MQGKEGGKEKGKEEEEREARKDKRKSAQFFSLLLFCQAARSNRQSILSLAQGVCGGREGQREQEQEGTDSSLYPPRQHLSEALRMQLFCS